MTEVQAFAEFHEELKLDSDEVDFARSFPDDVREALVESNVKTTHSFLQGSLARGTMVSPLKDVDMVVCLDRRDHGYLLRSLFGPDQAMGMLQEALENRLRPDYPDLRFGPRKRHALSIELGGGRPSFDLVPAFETTTDDDDVLIADREDKQWKRSNPRELIRIVSGANQEMGGRLIHVVRMIKHAVRTNLDERFPSLALESIAIVALDQSVSYAEACLLVFEKGAEILGGPIHDPTGRDDLAPKIDQIEPGFTVRAKEWFEEKVFEARCARERAVSGDHVRSIAWWHRVFGAPFPSSWEDKSAKRAAHGLAFGSVAPKPTRAWRRSSGGLVDLISNSGGSVQADSRMAVIGLADILACPVSVAEALGTLESVGSISVGRVTENRVVFQVVLLPCDSTGVFISQNYPVETVNIVVRSNGRIHAVPKSGKGRIWKHRNIYRDLCLWYPNDPDELRWSWDDGLEEYVQIVARHLIYEEYCRRTGEWPIEDAPHGGPLGYSWPIRTPEMRSSVKKGHHG